MKIAAVSDDGVTISDHFGRASLFVVTTVEDGKVVNREERAKTGHHTFAGHPHILSSDRHPGMAPEDEHGHGAGARVRHASMAATIDDCQVVIARGMGWGAYENMRSRRIEAVPTDVENIDEAVKLYVEGKLPNRMDRLH